MNSKKLQTIRNKIKPLLKKKEIIDVILFGSVIKGKTIPRDIDIAIISDYDIKENISGFHISVLKTDDFISNQPALITTLLKEGYSLKKNRPFSENFRFKQKVLFVYTLTSFKPSEKVRIVNLLRGKNDKNSLIREHNAEWLTNNVFISPIEEEYIFEQFLIQNKIRFKKLNLLIH